MNNHARIAVLFILLVGLPVLYVLSSGPAVGLVNKELLGYEAFDTIYWPLTRLYDRNPTAAKFFNWYDSVWLRLFGMETIDGSAHFSNPTFLRFYPLTSTD